MSKINELLIRTIKEGVLEINYTKRTYQREQTRKRFKKRVLETDDSLLCQECGGEGGWKEVILFDECSGPWFECGYCLGTGRTTKWLRGFWLRIKKKEKK